MRKFVVNSTLMLAAAGFMAFAQAAPPSSASQEAQSSPAGKSMTDSQMSTQVRQAIMNDNATQTVAHNVHVTTKNGMVTLKGKVDNQQEKDAVVAHAKQIAGDANVKDEITVK